MNYQDRYDHLQRYLAGELPLEEVHALEAALAADPELAAELQLLQLTEKDLPAFLDGELGPELNGWLPGLEALRDSGVPLWLLSILAGTVVVGMAGMRGGRRKGRRRSDPGRSMTGGGGDGGMG